VATVKLLALLTFLASGLGSCGVKSEADLRQQFYGNKEIVFHILEMQRHDMKVIRIAPEFTRLENDWSWPRKNIGFSEERWNSYRELFRKAGITDGIQSDDGYVFYFVSSEGLAVNGTSRGFVFTNTPPKNVAKSFDGCPAGKDPCYVLLDGPWYLFTWST
jgi:hypothetical protein